MAEKKSISLDEVLKNASNVSTFEKEDKKSKTYKRKTKQVNLYLSEEETKFIDEICEKEMLNRVVVIRRIIKQAMINNKNIEL